MSKGAQVVNALKRSIAADHKVPSARLQKSVAALVAEGAGVVASTQRLAPQGYVAPRRRSDRDDVMWLDGESGSRRRARY